MSELAIDQLLEAEAEAAVDYHEAMAELQAMAERSN